MDKITRNRVGCRKNLSRTVIYNRWRAMMARCYNPKAISYDKYGARGIGVALRWHDFDNFLADMGHPPEGMTIERIKNDKAYSPTNCVWATMKSQARNRRNNTIIAFNGKSQPIAAWADELGVRADVISHRFHRGWRMKECLYGRR